MNTFEDIAKECFRERMAIWLKTPTMKFSLEEFQMSHPQYGTGTPRVWNGVWFIRYDGEVKWHKITLNLSTDEAVSNYKWGKSIAEHYGPICTTRFEITSPDSVDLEEDYIPIEKRVTILESKLKRLKRHL